MKTPLSYTGKRFSLRDFTFSKTAARLKPSRAMMMTLSAVIMLGIGDAQAGTGGEEFAEVWDTLKDWIQGTLGRVVCDSMILVGIVAGVARQSISAFAVGIGGGIGLYNTPTVIESVLSATVTLENLAVLNMGI